MVPVTWWLAATLSLPFPRSTGYRSMQSTRGLDSIFGNIPFIWIFLEIGNLLIDCNYVSTLTGSPSFLISVMRHMRCISSSDSWLPISAGREALYVSFSLYLSLSVCVYTYISLTISFFLQQIPILEDKPPVQYPIPCCCLTFKPG